VESVKDICDLIKKYCESEDKLPCAVLVGNKSDKERMKFNKCCQEQKMIIFTSIKTSKIKDKHITLSAPFQNPIEI
jgi:hypothetical protein